jgi:hypothetical protein
MYRISADAMLSPAQLQLDGDYVCLKTIRVVRP